MAKDPHFPWYCQDFLVDVIQLDERLVGAYARLLSVMWINKFCLSNENDLLKISPSVPDLIKAIPEKFTFHPNGTFTSNRLELERAKRLKIREIRSEIGALGYQAKVKQSLSKDPSKIQAKDNDKDNDNEKEKKEEGGCSVAAVTTRSSPLPPLSLVEADQFKAWKRIYPRGVDGVFEGEAECEEWFKIHRTDTNFSDVITATRRYAASDKAQDPRFIKKPINFLNDWKAWLPRPKVMDHKAAPEWRLTGTTFGPCSSCDGIFTEWYSGATTKAECNKCRKPYVAPPGSAEKAILEVHNFKIGGKL